jgi:hypothetical protein
MGFGRVALATGEKGGLQCSRAAEGSEQNARMLQLVFVRKIAEKLL